ncbi:hypothetical protein [uncultured Vibrio sp.]|jgi:hypothetical protein|uniref:hypothetical protein n=1 Tax=uncultured Vibrio sp. TaxID=114054 RepID=UPI0029C79EA7|nr:hypothetical protein [uncultured Vibrio sp.]|eukprot:Anaeramoba_flamelloidesa808627_102.p3 GENE.a808627_102~~a808627_102.p3  ORF type:complete len:206 (-),score=2.47 a808627_102:178-795(-)
MFFKKGLFLNQILFLKKNLVALCLLILAHCFSQAVSAREVIELKGLEPLPQSSLAQYRGGFQVTSDYVINIGLSVITTINGQDIFNSSIANLVIENGNLSNINTNQGALDQSLVNIVQIGEGNSIEDETISDHITGMPQIPNFQQSDIINSEFINSSIVNIIQNTTDNSVIGLSTIIDIDAQVSGVIQQIQANSRLEDALLNHLD